MKRLPLIIGDLAALAVITAIGFATHGEIGISYLPRFLAAYVPIALTWFLLAPWFSLFDESVTRNAAALYRPALTVIFAAPLAAVLRGFLLGEDIQPIFALVFVTTNAAGMVAWRAIWLWLSKKI
jgi:hypothetical protein